MWEMCEDEEETKETWGDIQKKRGLMGIKRVLGWCYDVLEAAKGQQMQRDGGNLKW